MLNKNVLYVYFNPSMDKQLHQLQSVGWNYLSILELQRRSHLRLQMDRSIQFNGPVHIYPCWSMLT